jgi:glycosyltransferase involved in cell wall biosynthesis
MKGLPKMVEWHATTEQEKANIQNVFGPNARVWTVPNFPRVMDVDIPEKQKDVLELVTVALISPMKNHLLVLKALKHVSTQVVYHIYGPVKDGSYWNACLSVIEELPANITVKYHGDVTPDKLHLALANGHVAILPSKSENFGHSIFEAFTAGKPVITSHTTPWNGLKEEKAGLNVGIGDEQEITAAISFFAGMDNEEFRIWSASARQYALRSVDFEKIKRGYLAMFEGVESHDTEVNT